MYLKYVAHYLVGLFLFVQNPQSRAERGLSQSAENAILLAGAVVVAGVVIAAMKAFVTAKMPK